MTRPIVPSESLFQDALQFAGRRRKDYSIHGQGRRTSFRAPPIFLAVALNPRCCEDASPSPGKSHSKSLGRAATASKTPRSERRSAYNRTRRVQTADKACQVTAGLRRKTHQVCCERQQFLGHSVSSRRRSLPREEQRNAPRAALPERAFRPQEVAILPSPRCKPYPHP